MPHSVGSRLIVIVNCIGSLFMFARSVVHCRSGKDCSGERPARNILGRVLGSVMLFPHEPLIFLSSTQFYSNQLDAHIYLLS